MDKPLLKITLLLNVIAMIVLIVTMQSPLLVTVHVLIALIIALNSAKIIVDLTESNK